MRARTLFWGWGKGESWGARGRGWTQRDSGHLMGFLGDLSLGHMEGLAGSLQRVELNP